MTLRSAIYAGHVVHARQRPRRHALHYRVFTLLLDLDELEDLGPLAPLLAINRPGLMSFFESDHGDGRPANLRAWVEATLAAAGIVVPHPRIEVLCYPRMFGYVFNPLTVYFCADASGHRLAILYEVCNTFGERRTYLIPAPREGRVVRHSCAKQLYVSPFVPMDCVYDFHIEPPEDGVLVRIDESDAEGPFLRAVFSGKRLSMTAGSLARTLIAYPLMTLKVMGAIHWEALKLWVKGVPHFRHQPAANPIATTLVPASSAEHAPGEREPEAVGQ